MTPEDRGSDLGGIPAGQLPEIIEEIEIEDLAVDGICGVY
jgi:mycofactocin precursor